jgi:hypothetical protein
MKFRKKWRIFDERNSFDDFETENRKTRWRDFFPPSSRSINFLLAIWQEDRVCCGMFFKLFPSREYLVQNLARYFPFRFVSAKRYLAE